AKARDRARPAPDTFGLDTKLAMLDRQVRRLDGLIDALLDVARIRSGHLVLMLEENVDLSKVVRDVVERFEGELARASCTLVVSGIDEPIRGSWDALRLEQVLGNLLANAVKYGAGQAIEIDV